MRVLRLVPLFFVLAFGVGCGLFSDDPADDPFDVVVTEQIPLEFSIDDEDLCPPNEDCSAEPQPSPGAVDLPEIEIPVPIDVVEMTGNPELREISTRLKKVEIEKIEYEITSNTLNIPTPEVQVYMGQKTQTSHTQNGVFLLTTLPPVEAMATPSGTAEVEESAREQSSELFKQLEFAGIMHGDKNIEEGELFPPQGKADYKLIVHLKFTANPKEL